MNMASITPEDAESPNTASLGRKNKLGYTRISVACGHCRRRKIRCVRAEEDPEGRCANCIKLKKECVFTSVDTTSNDGRAASKAGLSSQTSSAMSHSPAGRDIEQYDATDRSAQAFGVYGDTPSGFAEDHRLAVSQGMMAPTTMLPNDSVSVARAQTQDWQSSPLETYGGPQIPISWSQVPEHLRGYGQANLPQGGPQYSYLDHARTDPARIGPWTSAEQTPVPLAPTQMNPLPGYAQQGPQGAYHPSFTHNNGPSVSQSVIPSQYYPQRTINGPPGDASGYGWSQYQQESMVPGTSRHDSMATNWSRGTSYSAGPFSTNYDPRSQSFRRPKDSSDPPG